MQYKILIVDDDENICELLRLYLEKDGFETVVANDGLQAVQFAAQHNPDLILLDIMLPSRRLAGLPRDTQNKRNPDNYAYRKE